MQHINKIKNGTERTYAVLFSVLGNLDIWLKQIQYLPVTKLAEVSNKSAKSRQPPKPNTIHLAQVGIAARGSSTPKYIVTTTRDTTRIYVYKWRRNTTKTAHFKAVNTEIHLIPEFNRTHYI